MLYALLLLMASVASEVAVKDFDAQLDFLKRTRVQDVGRDALVVSYEKLIADNAKHPKVAQAMLDLVGIYRLVDPDIKLDRDPEKSNYWLERAAATAPKGSALWLTAQQGLVGRYQYTEPKRAGAILDEIVAAAPGHSLTMARVEKARMTLAFSERRCDDAVTHAVILFTWYHDPTRIPRDGFEKADLDALLTGAGSELIQSLRNSSLSFREKKEKLKYFTTNYSWIPQLSKGAEKAIASLPDDPEVDPKLTTPTGSRTPLMWLLYCSPGVALVGVLCVRARRKGTRTT